MGADDGQTELSDHVERDGWVALGEMVDQHAAPLEAQQTRVTLVDVAVVVRRRLLLSHMHHLYDKDHWVSLV